MVAVSIVVTFHATKRLIERSFAENITPQQVTELEESCRLKQSHGGLHYEIELIEEARSLFAEKVVSWVKRRTEVIEAIKHSRSVLRPGDQPDSHLLALFKELKEIGKKMEEIATEGEWLEMQAAKKKYGLLMAQQQHVLVSL